MVGGWADIFLHMRLLLWASETFVQKLLFRKQVKSGRLVRQSHRASTVSQRLVKSLGHDTDARLQKIDGSLKSVATIYRYRERRLRGSLLYQRSSFLASNTVSCAFTPGTLRFVYP